jgi:tRNA pseudouridine55 synthase
VPNVRESTGELFGLLLLDKPAGLSSNRALQRLKRLVGADKAGHAGSLDPLATGMLPIFFGAATRLTSYLLTARKTYRVTATLGTATVTGDAEGAITIDRSSEPPPASSQVADALAAQTGEIEQVPPMFSALKRGGVPLYRLARKGLEVPREPRRVVIEELRLESYAWPSLTLTVRCSKGTYIRTLVEDIAKLAGTVAHVANLRRLSVEPFAEGDMHTFEAVETAVGVGSDALERLLLPADAALVDWPAARLTAADAARVGHGQAVAPTAPIPVGLVKVYGPEDQLIAIATATGDGQLRPERVFTR